MKSLQCIFFLTGLAIVANDAIGVSDNDTSEEFTSIAMSVVHEVNLNHAFDRALSSIRKSISTNGMDPMEMPDIDIPLSGLPGLLNTKMILHKGHIQQLATVERTGDVILQYSREKLSLYANVGWEMLDLSHRYTLRYMLYTRKGDCYGRYQNVKARMLIDFDLKRRKLDLKFFKFMDVGDFEIKLEGHLIDGFINVISKAVNKVFRTEVLQKVEAKAYDVIHKTIQEINDLIPSPMDFAAVPEETEDDFEFVDSYGVDEPDYV